MNKKIDIARELGPSGAIHYEVFARQDSKAPLAHIGSVDAPNDSLAKARAWYVFDHHQWLEMLLVPAATIIPVLHESHYASIKGA